MTVIFGSGRQPLTDRQRDGLERRIIDGEIGLSRTFSAGGGHTITASPGQKYVHPEIPHADPMDLDLAGMSSRAIQQAIEYATYGPGYWRNSSSECVWVSLIDENGESIAPPSAITLPDSHWCWSQECGESVEVARPLLLTVSNDGLSINIIHADNGEELIVVTIREVHDLLSGLIQGNVAPVSDNEQCHVREGNGSDEVEFVRGRQDHPGHLQVIVSLHHLGAALSGWVMMHTE